MDLTKRQQEIFDFIKTLLGEARLSADRAGHRQGRRPDVVVDGPRAPRQPREARAAAPRSVQAARDRAARPRDARRARRGVERDRARRAAGGLPLVGSVAAGQPILAEENIEEYVPVPPAAGGEDGEYVLRVRGDSMIDAGILEGDYVVVRPQETAGDGEIVVALVGEEATVKRFFRESDHVRLQPENQHDGADPLEGRARPGAGGGSVPERVMSSATLTRPRTARVALAPDDGWRPTLDDAARRRMGGPPPPRRDGMPGLRRRDGRAAAGRAPARRGHCRDCGSVTC